MSQHRSTRVYVLSSMEQVDRFCSFLRDMKDRAPMSLKLNIAITATREVTFVGDHSTGPEQDLLRLTEMLRPRKTNRRRPRTSMARPKE